MTVVKLQPGGVLVKWAWLQHNCNYTNASLFVLMKEDLIGQFIVFVDSIIQSASFCVPGHIWTNLILF